MRIHRCSSAFTLVEMLVGMGIFGVVAVGLLTFTSTSVRLIIRNLSTNHSHDTVRAASQRILADIHSSASRLRLVDFNGTTYLEVAQSVTSDQDVRSLQYVSTRSNGVRFYRCAGGPYQITANVASVDTGLRFDFTAGSGVPYVPQVGDRVILPLLNCEFGIVAVPIVPTSGSPVGKIIIDATDGVGFSITTGSGKATTGYFYRKAAYSVHNSELRYHANFEGASKGTYVVVRGDVTSPKPFALLYPTSTSLTSEALNLRVSLESADLDYTSRSIKSATATLQTIVPARNQPPEITNTN